MPEELAENFFIIFLAYVAAFLPWTAVSSTDFISPSWKTIRSTRRAGYTNLLLAAIPALYILFYITLQSFVDYKEMFAAIVALLFSILHIIRTMWGIWQLRIFTRWASNSIRALENLGIRYKPRNEKYKTTDAIVQHLLVNDSLIDNQLFHGHARCYLHYDGWDFKTDPNLGGVLYQRIALIPKLFLLALRYILNYLRNAIFLRPIPPFRQIPHQPIDVWLRWSVAFTAQGLSHWIRDFTVATDPDIIKHISNKALYDRRRAYFAGQVLGAAGMQLWPDDDFPLTDLGNVCKMDLFWPAVFSGAGLPFSAPQTDVLSETVGDISDLSRSAYRPYSRKLARVVETMPVMFGKDIEDFDVEMWEWLTIFLNLGTQIMEERGELDLSETSYTSDSTKTSSTTVGTSEQSEEFLEQGEDELDDGDLALDNLRTQLGFGTEDKAPNNPEMGIASFSAVPLPNSCFHALSEGNRLVTKVGELIDCWLALVAGDQLKFLLGMDPKWTTKCLGVSATGDISSPPDSPTPPHSIQRTNESLRSSHLRVEKARLAYQFAMKRQPYWHMEQTLTFMGHTLEVVRTSLARWVRDNEEQRPDAWEPEMFEEGETKTAWTDFGTISKPFSRGMAKARDAEYFDQRAVQVRILWELQAVLRNQLYDGAASPSSLRAIMLCMLGFPSLDVEVMVEDDDSDPSERDMSTQQGKDAISLFLGLCRISRKSNIGENEAMKWVLNIRPMCGPQDISILAKFVPLADNSYNVYMRLFRGSLSRDDTFEWEWWRDAAMSRMDGLRQWQRAHKIRNIELSLTNECIDAGTRVLQVILKGTGKRFVTWSGWEPFRYEHCRFELESRGFLLHFESNKVVSFMTGESLDDARRHRLPRAERRALSYVESEREQLRHSCFVIREVIPEEGRDEPEEMSQLTSTQRAERLIEEAKNLYESGSENFDRAVLLLEVASVELDSIKALQECVRLLTDPTATTRDPRRAARLIENCLASNLKKRHGEYARLTQADEDFGSDAFHRLFADLVIRGGFTKETVIPFCNYLQVVISVDQGTSIPLCFCGFRRMFLISRQYEVLEVMATTLRSTRVGGCDLTIDLSDECYERVGRNERLTLVNVLSKELYERCVSDGQNVSAMNELGLLLQQGAEGVTREPVRSLNLFRYGIEHGSGYALNNLGMLLLNGGDGVERVPLEGVELLERAVKRGFVGAMYNLAVVLVDPPEGVMRDVERGVELLEGAIKGGRHVLAMYRLGCMYEIGEGVERNFGNAVGLFEMAVAEGYYAANQRLRRLLELATPD